MPVDGRIFVLVPGLQFVVAALRRHSESPSSGIAIGVGTASLPSGYQVMLASLTMRLPFRLRDTTRRNSSPMLYRPGRTGRKLRLQRLPESTFLDECWPSRRFSLEARRRSLEHRLHNIRLDVNGKAPDVQSLSSQWIRVESECLLRSWRNVLADESRE